ncbi:GYDIA family GHMP kinase [Flavobacterium subsaxonicum]|uniref:GHMP kinase n=1 Tax=Flavobacterium subsaxonicum WB 4.1-42 = DSM 21790 TaxID=1121898 RepID=A0A0A2MN78_9FLAO|nr:GYDIA family GHMP kinase [Flavobacterium subsaxonicum]KGO94117.1 GHMP kinase [Flavobacterium subsaxonicum WB 4.1-42 = DSM 21790]
MKKTFYSNGKLLITAEYTVLDGAKALALPTKFGQSLAVEPNDSNTINWTSYDADGSVWFDEALPIEAIILNQPHTDKPEVITLINILHKAHLANPALLQNKEGLTVSTHLTFPRHWGLGTSSTLINNIAQWFGINAYTLLAESFGGSGYDIACAQHNTPVIYQIKDSLPVVSPVSFNPAFISNIWFVYLNQKQNSREAIAAYREHRKDIAPIITRIDALTNDALLAGDLQAFASALEKHEALMAGVLGIAPVQEKLFPDFKGVVKSLGAWGGDFVMAVAEENPTAHFTDKGYTTIIAYSDMIL